MSEFLTVTQAAQQTGRSASSIRRRIIYPIIQNDQHPDRSLVEPSVEEVQRLRMKGESFPWRVSRELLDRYGPSRETAELPKEKIFSGVGDEPSLREVVTLLHDQLLQSQQQLKVKDDQIAAQLEITKSLNERLREGNILIGSLQRQLSLTSGGLHPTTDAADTTMGAMPDAPAASAPKPPKTAPKKSPKKGFFARMFN
jgi:hypothetical protein